jgi:predicted regulator of Ras-like GTPase activity (Roadblock/LC7/MglB family)
MEKGSRMTNLDSIVATLQRHHGVMGVMLVGVDDGMVIAGDAGTGRDSDTAAALAASLFRRTRTAAGEAGLGAARFVRLEADRGHLCATARDDIVIVTVASSGINLGKLRLDMLSAVEML